MTNFADQYRILAEIKTFDDKVLHLKQDLEHIPKQIAKLNALLDGHKTTFEGAKTGVSEGEKALREAERELKVKEEELLKAETKMMEVKTNDEYKAAMKENEAQKKVKTQMEEQILVLMDRLEAERQTLGEAEGVFKREEAEVNEQKAELEKQRSTLEKALNEQQESKKESESRLDGMVADAYRRATRFHGEHVLVEVRDGQCLRCHLRIQPQVFNEILGAVAIHRCETCNKILVIVPTEEDKEASSDSAG